MFRLTGVFRAVRRTDLCRSLCRTDYRTDLCRSISRTVCRTDLCRSISRTILCRTDLCRSISRTVCRTDLCRSISRTVCRTDYWTLCRSILCRTDSRTTILCRSFCSSTDMAKGKFYYAVKTGFKPGVYSSWDECKSQVDKFPAASFKKFASEKDAWAFFRGVEPSPVPEVKKVAPCVESADALLPKRGPEPLEYIPLGKKRCHSDEDAESQPKRVKPSESSSSESSSSESTDGFTYMGDAVVVYTDGCCSCNGQKGARAGIGVYWGHNHPLNAAEPLEGRQTNQRAEVQAACKALEQAKENNIKKLVLYTDSKFTINGVTTWVKNWKLNGWRLKSGGQITNKDDFVKLDRLNAELEVVWLHIPGHAGYKGNEEADRLSREGAAKPRQQQ